MGVEDWFLRRRGCLIALTLASGLQTRRASRKLKNGAQLHQLAGQDGEGQVIGR